MLEEAAQKEGMTEGGRTHACRTASDVHRTEMVPKDEDVFRRLHGDVGDAAVPRAAQLYHDGKNGLAQATGENPLAKTGIFSVEIQEEGVTAKSWKEGREKCIEKPPPENFVATSGGFPIVPPTLVTKGPAKLRRCGERIVPVPVNSMQGKIIRHAYRMRGEW